MKFNHINHATLDATYTQGLEAISMNEANSFVVQYDITVTTPSAGTFTAATTDLCTKVGHGMVTGLKVRVSSTVTLPAGLAAATDYFVVAISADTFKLAATLNDAIASTPVIVDITSTGSGVHTITPTSLAGGVLKMQESVDGTTWYDISGVTANITATVKALFTGTSKCGQIRPHLTMTAGQLSVTLKTNTKE